MRKGIVGFSGLLAAAVLLAAATARAGDTVYYYHTDALHSEVVLTDASHNVVERTYYGPYGEVLNRSLRDGPGYGGHEEDAATGLDNLQQRYYDPITGRFPSIDPVDVDTTTGENFNRYAYANDNPYRFTDPDGRWPTKIHEEIIDKAFPGLSKDQRDTLKSASSSVDSLSKGGQSVERSYQHSMRSPSESSSQAKQETQKYVSGQISDARKAQGVMPKSISDLKTASLSAVGNAIHTETDGTSPAHVDSNGSPKVWPGALHLVNDVQHHEEESHISPSQMSNAVESARATFLTTYGSNLYQQVIESNGH